MGHPFSLDSTFAYENWRNDKLKGYPAHVEDLITIIDNPLQLSAPELISIRRSCAKTNFAIYECKRRMEKADVRALGRQLGLVRLDRNLRADNHGISSLQVEPHEKSPEYVPYSNQLLNWHTDGYYNPGNLQIRAFILHCARPAASGGETRLLDHEIAYLLLREQDPSYIRALMHPQAMTIPANKNGGTTIRGEITGPVFSVSCGGDLNMRYTSRTRSIGWRNNAVLSRARKALTEVIADHRFVINHTLQPNQGVICNNALHARTAFEDSPRYSRLIFRARYYDRVEDT